MAAAKTILLIDDDPDIVAAIGFVLEQRGYRVVTAGDGCAGLSVAQREQPHLVVVDMMMPKKSGFGVVEKLKGQVTAPPAVIMISANEGQQHQAYAELLGVDDYLRKPFAMEALLASVERLCPLTS